MNFKNKKLLVNTKNLLLIIGTLAIIFLVASSTFTKNNKEAERKWMNEKLGINIKEK